MNPNRFLVLPGHDNPAEDQVVEHRPGYWIVETVGAAAQAKTG
jgi:hypothetical protein